MGRAKRGVGAIITSNDLFDNALGTRRSAVVTVNWDDAAQALSGTPAEMQGAFMEVSLHFARNTYDEQAQAFMDKVIKVCHQKPVQEAIGKTDLLTRFSQFPNADARWVGQAVRLAQMPTVEATVILKRLNKHITRGTLEQEQVAIDMLSGQNGKEFAKVSRVHARDVRHLIYDYFSYTQKNQLQTVKALWQYMNATADMEHTEEDDYLMERLHNFAHDDRIEDPEYAGLVADFYIRNEKRPKDKRMADWRGEQMAIIFGNKIARDYPRYALAFEAMDERIAKANIEGRPVPAYLQKMADKINGD